jgi:hypothetical protein
MTTRIATHTYHTLDYYCRLLKALISLVKRKLTHASIADGLNDEGILTPTGRRFTRTIVSNTLKHLRLHEEFRPLIHHAMLELHFDGRLTHDECLSLLNYRPGTQ